MLRLLRTTKRIRTKIADGDLIAAAADANPPEFFLGFSEIARDFVDPFLELLRLLREAAEVEHSLMLQYLYAAFTIRVPSYLSLMGMGGNRPSAEPNDLLGVAIEEMVHLNTVNQFLTQLGFAPHWQRQDFPFETDIYPFELSLQRLTPSSLARYTYVEAPRWAVDPSHPDNQTGPNRVFNDLMSQLIGTDSRPNQLGSLYEQIILLIREVVTEYPDRIPNPVLAISNFEALKDEGEIEHYWFFRRVLLAEHSSLNKDQLGFNPWELDSSDQRYPSVSVPTNPSAFSGEVRIDAVWLSNLHYWSVLMLLDFSYRYADGTAFQLARDHMTGGLRPIGIHLASRELGIPFDQLSMGYTPGLDKASTGEFIIRLQAEIRLVSSSLTTPIRHYVSTLPQRTEQHIRNTLTNQ